MTDYHCSVHGHFTPELTWSFGYHLFSTAPLDTVLSTARAAWDTAWTDSVFGLEQLYPTSTVMDSVRVAQLDGTFHETQNASLPTGVPGTAAGDTLPYLNSVVIPQRSTFSKRWNRGRFYLPALEETKVNNNIVIPSATTTIKSALTAVFSSITADGSQVFVVSKKPHKDGTGLYAKTTIIKWEVSNKPARQSRRVKKQVAVYI